ncbi:MAG: FAD-dependent oxidoreductase [Deltaproteobacteria bacterium]|nr:FAD-dependent oxidoreductase [Deltaproteobacteria bacterium]
MLSLRSSSLPKTNSISLFSKFRTVICLIAILIFLTALLNIVMAAEKAPNGPAAKEQTLKEPERREVVIVGGGIAGLTAAHFLKNRDIALLEQSDRFGGRIVSGSFGGFNYPKGIAYIGIPQGPVETMIDELGIEPVEIPEPSEAFYYDGKFYFGTKGAAQLFIQKSSVQEYNRFVSTVQKLAKLYEESDYSGLPNELSDLDKMSARQWFETEKFPPIFLEIYESQALGLFGANLGRISALSFVPEIGFQFEATEPVAETKNPEQNGDGSDAEKESGAFTFQNGLSELPEALAKNLGYKARLNCKVTLIKPKDKIYEIKYVDQSGTEQTMVADTVIVATPAPVTLEIAKDLLNDEQKKIISEIKYSSYATVGLFSSTPIFDQAFNLGVGKGFVFTDLYDGSWVQRAHNPELNKVQERPLCAYIPDIGGNDKPLIEMSDQELVDKVEAGVEKIFPGARSKITGHDVQRFELAYPIMPPGAYQSLARLNDINQGKFLLAGDYMIYPTLEAAAESGYLAAMKVETALGGQEPFTDPLKQ